MASSIVVPYWDSPGRRGGSRVVVPAFLCSYSLAIAGFTLVMRLFSYPSTCQRRFIGLAVALLPDLSRYSIRLANRHIL